MRILKRLLILVLGITFFLQLPGCKNAGQEQKTVSTLSKESLNQLFTDNFTPFLNDMEDPTVKGKFATALDQFNIEYWTGHYQDAINDFQHLDSAQQNKQ